MKPNTMYAARLDLAIEVATLRANLADALHMKRAAANWREKSARWAQHKAELIATEPWHYKDA